MKLKQQKIVTFGLSKIRKSDHSSELHSELKKKRLELAKKENKPAFVIFSNKVLSRLLESKPRTEKELLLINGFGKHKVEKYGDEILKVINTYS